MFNVVMDGSGLRAMFGDMVGPFLTQDRAETAAKAFANAARKLNYTGRIVVQEGVDVGLPVTNRSQYAIRPKTGLDIHYSIID